MKIQCRTLFDITATGVTGHYKPTRMPFHDQHGNLINTMELWNQARNQQRNWETLTQIVSLRTQIDITEPYVDLANWIFEFEVSNDTIFSDGLDPLATLKSDCAGVPMLKGLGEQAPLNTVLVVDENIWFTIIPINN